MGGKADTGLGERDDEDDDDEDDIGHSAGFMSWRLRQKAVTCSVLCTEGDKKHNMSHSTHSEDFSFLKHQARLLEWQQEEIQLNFRYQKTSHLNVGMCRGVKHKTNIDTCYNITHLLIWYQN